MPVKSVVATLDEVPERLRAHYVEQADGSFALDADVENHPAVSPLKRAHDRVAAELEQRKAEHAAILAKLEAVPPDFDPEDWRRLKAWQAEVIDPEGVLKGQEERIAELESQLAAERAAHDREEVERALETALMECGIKRGLLKGAMALHMPSCLVRRYAGRRQPVARVRWQHVPISKFIAQWARSEEAQAFLAEPPRREPNDDSFAALISALR